MHGVGQVLDVVGRNSGHGDASVFRQIDAEIFGQFLNLKIELKSVFSIGKIQPPSIWSIMTLSLSIKYADHHDAEYRIFHCYTEYRDAPLFIPYKCTVIL